MLERDIIFWLGSLFNSSCWFRNESPDNRTYPIIFGITQTILSTETIKHNQIGVRFSQSWYCCTADLCITRNKVWSGIESAQVKLLQWQGAQDNSDYRIRAYRRNGTGTSSKPDAKLPFRRNHVPVHWRKEERDARNMSKRFHNWTQCDDNNICHLLNPD
jgi:hypothetical protein